MTPTFLKHLRAARLWVPFLAALGTCQATDFEVTTTDDQPYDGGSLLDETVDDGALSLREAVGLANANGGGGGGSLVVGEDDGDTIAFSDLLFSAGAPIFTLGSELVISDDVVIDGSSTSSPDLAIIDGASATRLIRVDTTGAPGLAAVTLQNLILRNGSSATTGGGIQLDMADPLTLDSVTLSSCTAGDGGAIYNAGSPLVLNGCVLSGNTANAASGSGGALFNGTGGTAMITGTSFDGNVANRAGGAIEDQSGGTSGFDITLTDSTFTGNLAGVAPAVPAPGNGGAIHITGPGSMMISGGSASGNLAGREGGAFWNGSGLMEITGTMITGNTASGAGADDGGGGIFNNGGTLTVTTATISQNTADGAAGSGGGIFSTAGTVTLTATTISGNTANRAGGGIELIDGTLNLSGSTLGGTSAPEGNIAGPAGSAAPGNGGGLHISGVAITDIDGGTVQFNTAAREGGGLWNQANSLMTVTGGTVVADNRASGATSDDGGGGIFNNSGLVWINDEGGAVTITRNVADGAAGSGGGLFNNTGGTIIAFGAAITENLANRAGGGIEDLSGPGTGLTLVDVTLDDNNAGIAPATAAPGNGGGLHITGPGDAAIIGGTVTGNLAAAEGGGLWNGTGEMTVSGTMVTDNTASGPGADQGGGGLFNAGGTLIVNAATMISGNIADGTSGSGGGILNDVGGMLTVTNSFLSGNRANRAGGGIEDVSGAGLGVVLTGVTMNGNNAGLAPAVAAPGNGGALHISGPGDITIDGGSVSGNTAALEGGGLWNGSGLMEVTGTTITNNIASGAAADDGGGGIFNNGGTLTANEVTLTGNIADGTSGSGGGLFSTDGTVTINQSTLAANLANRAGGGIEVVDGELILTDTILGGSNPADGNVAGPAGTANPGNGGALHISGVTETTITGGSVTWNVAAREGGGLWNQVDSTMTLNGGTLIADNTAAGDSADDGGGGIFNNSGIMVISDLDGAVTITRNAATGALGSGGGLFNNTAGTISIEGATISDNLANRAGGGIEDASGIDGDLVLIDCLLTTNKAGVAPAVPAPGSGGAIHVTGAGNVAIVTSEISGNLAASEGGGLWNGTGEMTIGETTIANNVASGAAADQGGGGLFNAGGTLVVAADTVVSGNIADGASGSGGGILNDASGTLLVTGVTISNNIANRAGGALEVTADTTSTLTECTVTGNTAGPAGTAAPGNGGAIHISGSGFVDTSLTTYDGNDAGNEGGGLWNSGAGTLVVDSCAVINNTAPDGGGLFNQAGAGDTSVINSTISGNSATNGAGLQVEGGFMDLASTTVAANTATGNGGGANLAGGDLSVINTILADNNAGSGPDLSGPVSSAEFSLLEDPSGSTGFVDGEFGNIVGVDPLLADLADNGGPTLTHCPSSSSPVIDAGDMFAAFGLPFDQRGVGFDRIQGGGVDLGAFELLILDYGTWADDNFTAATPPALRGPGDDPDGDSLNNATEWLMGLNPESIDAQPFSVSVDGGTLSFTFPRAKAVPAGAETLEISTDLQDFDPVAMPSRTATSQSPLIELVTLSISTGTEPRLFARLNIDDE